MNHLNGFIVTSCSFIKVAEVVYFVCLIVFYVTPTQYRSFGDYQALQVEEDLRCHCVHYFRHEQTGTRVEPPTFCKLAGYLPHMKESNVPVGIRTKAVRGKWFEVNNLNHSATDAPHKYKRRVIVKGP
jgi:hypothetical protein